MARDYGNEKFIGAFFSSGPIPDPAFSGFIFLKKNELTNKV